MVQLYKPSIRNGIDNFHLEMQIGDPSTTTQSNEHLTTTVNTRSGHFRQHSAALIASMMTLIFGLVLGWISPVLDQLQSTDGCPIGSPLTYYEIGILGTVTLIGGLIGSFLWQLFADKIGRKINGYLVGVIYSIGWSCVLFSYDKDSLFVGRTILGLASAAGCITCTMFINEIVEDSLRRVTSYIMIFINLGTLTSYALGAVFSYRILTGSCLTITIVFMLLFFWLPESPIYLWRKGDHNSAKAALLWYRGNNLNKVEQEIIKLKNMELNPKSATCSMLISTRENRLGMIIMIGLFFGQEFAGIVPILTFASSILDQSHIPISSNIAAIFIGIFLVIGSVTATLIVDKVGRKVLLMVSLLSVAIILTIFSIYFYLKDYTNIDVTYANWLPVILLCSFMVFYSLGIGTLTFVVTCEVLSPDIAPLVSSIGVFLKLLFMSICIISFPLLVASVGDSGCFGFYAICTYLTFVFTLLIVPETKDVPLIDMLFKLKNEPIIKCK